MKPFKDVFPADLRDCLAILDKSQTLKEPQSIDDFSNELNFSKITVAKRINYLKGISENSIAFSKGTIYPNYTCRSDVFAAYQHLIDCSLEVSLIQEFELHPKQNQRDFSIKFQSSDPTISNKVAKINRFFKQEMAIFERNTDCMKKRLDFFFFCLKTEQEFIRIEKTNTQYSLTFLLPINFDKAIEQAIFQLPKKKSTRIDIHPVSIRDKSHPFNFLEEFLNLNMINRLDFTSIFTFLLKEQPFTNAYQKNICIIYVYFYLIDHYKFSPFQLLNILKFNDTDIKKRNNDLLNTRNFNTATFDHLNKLYKNEANVRNLFKLT